MNLEALKSQYQKAIDDINHSNPTQQSYVDIMDYVSELEQQLSGLIMITNIYIETQRGAIK